MIAILDYGVGNLRSVQKAFAAVGHEAVITSDPAVDAARMILPGVGAFKDAVARLRESRLDQAVLKHIDAGKPLLGICLGLQLLMERSFEDGEHRGLGVFAGDVVPFRPQPGLKIPHMGWNSVRNKSACPLFQNTEGYFVHGYYAVPADESVVAGVTPYPEEFASVLWKENVFATQFHPEKSQAAGLGMLKAFAEIC